MKVHATLDEMTMGEKLVATKLAQAAWMTRHKATEKSFLRIPSGLRNMLINEAHELAKNAEKIGMKIEVETL